MTKIPDLNFPKKTINLENPVHKSQLDKPGGISIKQFTVRIYDLDQDTTHIVSQNATNQGDANRIALKELKRLFNTDDLEIK